MGENAPLLKELEESLIKEREGCEELKRFIGDKQDRLSDLPITAYPEKLTDFSEINICDSVIQNSTIIIDNTTQVYDYFGEVEKSSSPAGEMEGLFEFIGEFTRQLDEVKEFTQSQSRLIELGREKL